MTEREKRLSELAINGGPKVRTESWPGRGVLGQEEKAAVDALFDAAIASGGAFGYNGPTEQAYCEEFAEFMGGGYADAVNSGSSAIYVALRALDLEPFTEVIVSPITDCGGMMPIALINCIPVIADAAPGCYNTGPEQIEELVSPLTSAIVVAHIGGEPADIEAIMEIARKNSIPVVEDCAQAPGARMNGKLLGTFGDIAAFSTMYGKHFITGGQGGIVYTKSEELYKKARQASDRGKPFGLPGGATNCVASLNLNLNDLAAAIGRVQIKRLPETVQRRKDGSVFPVEVSSKHLWFGDQELHVAICRDITERKENEQDLLLTQFSVDHTSVGIMRIGSDAQILSANQHCCQLLGYTVQELRNLHIYDVDPNFPAEWWKDNGCRKWRISG